jgi:L-aspartate oxidase
VTQPRAIVVGSGIAGLTTALTLGDCIVVTKTGLGEGSSRWAQGGIAAAIGSADDPVFHAADTVAVAAGLADPDVARTVTEAGPDRIEWLIQLGARFDSTEDGTLVLGREAGHDKNRIVHANGDATGAEVMRTLRTAVRNRADITVMEHTWVVDLVRSGGHVVGVYVVESDGERRILAAPAVVLATGGIGRLYAATTNPAEVTGDGLAMAIRSGARVADPEFVQFHPTALRSALDPMPLLTEALRGAGATLVDGTGRRFMPDEHPDAELAPRDVVARATWSMLEAGHGVYLDATHLGDRFPDRFPTVYASATEAGLDPRREPMPVSPAAHYHMGGVDVDEHGRASLAGLYACGEVAATGLHGANRLASNSLLEGLVFGVRVAEAIRDDSRRVEERLPIEVPESALCVTTEFDDGAVADLRSVMWDGVGLMRSGTSLRTARSHLDDLAPRLMGSVLGRNLLDVARVVTDAAMQRTESRGGHHRVDHPEPAAGAAEHTIVTLEPAPTIPHIGVFRGAA